MRKNGQETTASENNDSLQTRKEDLAKEILAVGRDRILTKLRFLDQAVFALPPVQNDRVVLAANGRKLYYRPDFVLDEYRREDRKSVV